MNRRQTGASDGASDSEPAIPLLIVPAYFHPAADPQGWARLSEHAARLRLVVLNLANGPGTRPDPAFLPGLDRLRSAQVPVAGYVDTAYGQRASYQAMADLDRYLDWYQVDGVFFDRASASAEHLSHYAEIAGGARRLGARLVALNHGTHPIEAYAEHADLLGTFEGPWAAYLELAVPRWVRSRPAERFFHLAHCVPAAAFADAFRLASRRNAGCAYVTNRCGANPWDGLPDGELSSRPR